MRVAVFTIVKNETVFLPLWYAHYSKFFSPNNIYILNNGDHFNSYENIIPIAHPRKKSFDHGWLRDQVSDMQRRLLEHYDWVLFSEADEFVCSRMEPFDRYLLKLIIAAESRGAGYIKFSSKQLLHNKDEEPKLDVSKPILSQRNWWLHYDGFDKALLTRVPLKYEEGFHNLQDTDDMKKLVFLQTDPDECLMIHLHRMDFDIAKARNEQRAIWDWNEDDAIKGKGIQNRITGDLFKEWFMRVSEEPSEIPDKWKRVL